MQLMGNGEFAPFIRDISAYGLEFKFLITDSVANDWYRNGHQEFVEREWCRDRIRPGMVAVDCGAHHGMMTLLFARWVGASGQVYAYDVLLENADIVERNARLNGLTNVIVRPVGLGDKSGVHDICVQHGNAVVASALRPPDRKITLTRLDDEFGNKRKIDLLKLDVEGSELYALQGAIETIKYSHPLIDLELHTFLYQDSIATVAAIFETLGEAWSVGVSDDQGPIVEMGRTPNLAAIAAMKNPHVYLCPL